MLHSSTSKHRSTEVFATYSESKNRIAGVIYRQLVLYWRHLDRKFDTFFWPTLDAILFGAIGTFAQRNGGDSTLIVMLSGFVMAQLVWQSHINISKFFIQEMWDQNVLYMMTRPLRAKELVFGAIALTAIIGICAVTFITLMVMLVFGYTLESIPMGVIALMPILMLMGWSTGMLATSLVIRLGQKADNFIWALFGLIGPLSGSIVPPENLPTPFREFATILPMTHAYEAGRRIIFGNGDVMTQLIIAGAGALILYGIALFVLNKSVRSFRQKGYISRYV